MYVRVNQAYTWKTNQILVQSVWFMIPEHILQTLIIHDWQIQHILICALMYFLPPIPFVIIPSPLTTLQDSTHRFGNVGFFFFIHCEFPWEGDLNPQENVDKNPRQARLPSSSYLVWSIALRGLWYRYPQSRCRRSLTRWMRVREQRSCRLPQGWLHRSGHGARGPCSQSTHYAEGSSSSPTPLKFETHSNLQREALKNQSIDQSINLEKKIKPFSLAFRVFIYNRLN